MSFTSRPMFLALLILASAGWTQETRFLDLGTLPIHLPAGIAEKELLDRIAPWAANPPARLRSLQSWPGSSHRHLALFELGSTFGMWNGQGAKPILVSFVVFELAAPGELPRIIASSPRPFDLGSLTSDFGWDDMFTARLSFAFDPWRIRPGVPTFSLRLDVSSQWSGGCDVAYENTRLFAVAGNQVLDALEMPESMHDVNASRFDGELEIAWSIWGHYSYKVLSRTSGGFHDIRQHRSRSGSHPGESPGPGERTEIHDSTDYRWSRQAGRYLPASEWAAPPSKEPDCAECIASVIAARHGEFADSVQDVDGNTYHALAVGGRLWLVENLRTTRFIDGKPIPRLPANTSPAGRVRIGDAAQESPRIGREDARIRRNAGARYDARAARSGRLAPKGWHVATDAEWRALIDSAGGLDSAGWKLRELGVIVAADPMTGAVPDPPWWSRGESEWNTCSFGNQPVGEWWTATMSDSARSWSYHITQCDPAVTRHASSSRNLFFIRLVKD